MMKRIFYLNLFVLVFTAYACEDKENKDPEFLLNTDPPSGYITSGFSFKKMRLITVPNSENIIPDFIVACLMNEIGEIGGPFLSHPNLENRFVLVNSYDNITSAQKNFDTIATLSNKPYQTLALDIKPYEIWQIKTSSDELGIILLLETRAEKIGLNAFAEVRFKAKKLLP